MEYKFYFNEIYYNFIKVEISMEIFILMEYKYSKLITLITLK